MSTPEKRNRESPSSAEAFAWLELTLASALWGFGFVAARWALTGFGPYWMNAIRFLLAAAICAPLCLLRRGERDSFSRLVQLAFLPALTLWCALIFQGFGLLYTDVNKSLFITCLYVVFVPLFESLRGKSVWRPQQVLALAIGLTGVGLLSGFSAGGWNIGDALTLACAILSAIQIIAIGRAAAEVRSPIAFSLCQMFWAASFSLVAAAWLEPYPRLPIPSRAVIGLITLVLGSTVIGFFIQVRSQRRLSPTTVSMLFLLECPFGSFFAFAVLGERLLALQWVGAAFILVAAVLTILRPQEPGLSAG